MEKFWATILIFVVVAAAGLMYVNQVYIPQKDSQAAMADMANQTLSAVKVEIGDDSITSVVDAGDVIDTVRHYCKAGNNISIWVDGTEYIEDTNNIETKVDSSKEYTKTIIRVEGVIDEIRFKEI
ncbi:MAG: hypothetical protein PHS15_07885 [Clostridiaceae bacterium]|nr:hypothetical protein [Clostridiaceae bacterium]